MKRNFDAPMMDLEGKPFADGSTLKSVSVGALLNLLEEDRHSDGQAKQKLFALALRVNAGGDVDVAAEDIALLKDRIGKSFGAIVVGRAYQMLEGE